MFDLDITEETAAVFTLCRSLGLDVAYPAARGAERDAAIPEHLRGALFDTGLLAPVDERFGGGGRPTAPTQCAAVEALAYGDPGLTIAAVWSGAVTEILAMVGTEGQQAAVLPRFASDPMAHGALALYEGHGRAPSESTTTVSRTGGGQWLVRGTKLAVAGAATADPLIVVGTDPADGRIRLVMMRPGQLGVEIADPQRHIGLDAARLSTVTLDATVDDAALVGGVDADRDRVDVALSRVRLLLATAMLGTAQRSVDYASKYATERVAFGKPIAAFQGVSFLLADASIRIAAARIEVMELASRIAHAMATDLEAHTTEAVNYSGVVATQATRDAIQVLGGHGFITDHPVELWYRSAMAMAALDFDPLCTAFEPAL